MVVNEFTDGLEVDQVLIVQDVERRSKRDGGEYLRLRLGDRTGSVTAMVWEGVEQVAELAGTGEPVHVSGRYTVHPRFGPQIGLRDVRAAEQGTFTLSDLVAGPGRTAEAMEADLRELIGTIRNPYLEELLRRVFDASSPLWAAYRDAPAAKVFHQAYRHGLLEHSLTVAQAVGAASITFPGIDREVAVTGALLHDIGKLQTYTGAGGSGQGIEMTDIGKLQGEIALGYYTVRRELEQIEGFPQELAFAILHIILSHHGSLEHGSPVVPCTREAILVHMIDNLGGKLGSFDRIERELPPGQRWSSFDRALQGSAFFAGGEDQGAPDGDRQAAEVCRDAA